MPLSVPPELKKLTQFVRRAEELDRDRSRPESRLVAYYCRQHAVTLGLDCATPAARACLSSLLSALEAEKEAMAIFSREESAGVCERFAMRIFEKADAELQEGRGCKGTARAFYAAATFFEVAGQFGAVEEIEEKRKYAKWKATEILKALREGRPIEGVEMPIEGDVGVELDLGGMPVGPPVVPPPVVPPPVVPPPVVPRVASPLPPAMDLELPLPVPLPVPSGPPRETSMSSFQSSDGPVRVSKEKMKDAAELTRFALKALESRDSDLAAERLLGALEALGR